MEAVLYSRVSSARQVADGHGLDSQEHSCRKFAVDKGLTVIKSFKEPGISGGKTDRPAMQQMVAFLRRRKAKGTIVVIDDLKRFSRDVGGYWELKQLIGDCNAQLMSPKHEFANSPEGRFIETMLVASGQLEREQNARQVVGRMRARLEQGYWCFPDTLPGLKYVKEAAHGKIMRRKEPEASIVAEALEGYASGRFEFQTDVMRFFEKQKLYKKPRVEHVRQMVVQRAVFYAGYLEYPKWGVKLTKGKHDALISFATYQKIQKKLKETSGVHDRKYDRPEFPLRGYVTCECGKLLTASHSRGRKERYAYYFCFNKKCTYYGKAIKADDIEGDFKELLMEITPTAKMLALSQANLQKRWEERLKNLSTLQTRLKKKYEEISEQIERLAVRAANTASESAAKAYEQQMDKLEKEKVGLQEEMKNFVNEQLDFRTALEMVTDYLSKPLERWEKGDLDTRRKLLRMCFKRNMVYERKNGFRTADLSLTYAIITGRKALQKQDSGHGRN